MHVDRVILCLYKNACDGKQPIFVFVDKIDIIIIINIFIITTSVGMKSQGAGKLKRGSIKFIKQVKWSVV